MVIENSEAIYTLTITQYIIDFSQISNIITLQRLHCIFLGLSTFFNVNSDAI